jgi:hypothetical protein
MTQAKGFLRVGKGGVGYAFKENSPGRGRWRTAALGHCKERKKEVIINLLLVSLGYDK